MNGLRTPSASDHKPATISATALAAQLQFSRLLARAGVKPYTVTR